MSTHSDPSTETVEVSTGASPEGSVIWLHGLGADGHDFEPIVPELDLQGLALRFVFPHAPVRPVTLNGGMAMRAWYDIVSLDRQGAQDEAGIRASAETLHGLVAREIERGIPHNRIVLAGFSQGGAIALHAALRTRRPLAGLMALSTYLPLEKYLDAEVAGSPDAQTKELPIFMAHGRFDPVLTPDLGEHSRRRMEAIGYSVEWRDYPMPHSVCPEEIADIGRWLRTVFG